MIVKNVWMVKMVGIVKIVWMVGMVMIVWMVGIVMIVGCCSAKSKAHGA